MATIEDVELGFAGGPVIVLRLSDAKLKELRKALDKPQGWADIETEGGSVALNLAQVVFVRTNTPVHSVGFGG